MLKKLFPLFALILFGCSTPLPHFVAPPAAPTKRAIDATVGHIDAATLQAKSLKQLIAQAVSLSGENKPLKLTLSMADKQVDSLTQELLSAKRSAGDAQAALKTLDDANQKVIGLANAFAAKAQATIDKRTASRDRWRKAGIYEGLALLAAGAWIFKKPLFALARTAIGIP